MKNNRKEQMIKLYRSGKTLEQIGNQYGITKERVRQIIRNSISAKEGGKTVSSIKSNKEKKDKKLNAEIQKFGCSYAEKQLIPSKFRVAFTCKLKLWKATTTCSITIKEWYDLWLESGHIHQRGKGKGTYVMIRIDKTKPYQIDNMHIILLEESSRETMNKTHARRKIQSNVNYL